MNELGSNDSNGAPVLDAATVRAFHDRLDEPLPAATTTADGDGAGTEDLWAQARALSELQNAISARLAHVVVTAHEQQRDCDDGRGIARKATKRLVGSQVGFARRCTPHRGSHFVNLAHALVKDMPHTLSALASGVISEHDAHQVVQVTSGLTHAERAHVDHGIRDDLGTVTGRRLAHLAKEQACQVAPEAIADRRKHAEQDRRVSLRPAPDNMCRLSALLPVKDGLACMAALNNAADTEKANAETQGRDARPRDQVMADTLTERITGRARHHNPLGVTVNLILPTDTLLGDTPAHVPGYGPVPADLVREWVATGDPTGPQIRRLFTHPGTGDIVGMDTRARTYPGLLARLILFRDQTCRTPWCSAPVRHTDHITRHTDDGETSERNGQGLCARCNYTKEHPDYRVTGHAGHTTIRTAGFTTHSRPPAPPGQPPPTNSHPERTLMDVLFEHGLRTRDHEDDTT
ncbi:DUF222 domain-containing protein [Flexivirga sp. B27]